jgi:CheY-like chemotaxis protein
MRKRNTDGGSWLELGCQIIHKDDVRRLRLQEEHLAKVRSKVQSMGKVNILVVGTRLESLKKVLTSPAGLRQYIVKFTENHRDVLDAIKKNPTQMIIFGQGDLLLSDPQLKACFDARPSAMATLAIIEREDARKQLLQAGIDECLSDNSCEEFIFRAIERALLGHAVGSTAPRQLSGEVLIVSVHNARVNLISFLLEENGYNVCVTNTLAEAKYQVSHCFDAVFADYQPGNSESCAAIMEHFSGLPLIALCDQLSDGREAVEKGASNYLCMPLDKEDIRMIIKQLMATTAPTAQAGTSAIT